jgi:hypothetical protein
MKALLSKIDASDVGLGLLGLGAAYINLGAGFIAVGLILILQVRPLRTWL